MKRLMLSLTAAALFFLCFSITASGEKIGVGLQTLADTIAKNNLLKVRVSVKDLMDGTAIDSAYVVIGLKIGYTNQNGIVEFDQVAAGSNIIIRKDGYLAISKKAKAEVKARLCEKEISSSVPNYNNGLYQRPLEHFSGSAVIISGNDLRRVNSISFIEALKYYAPSFIAYKDNNYGDDPNSMPLVNIRGAYNFPVSATIANKRNVPATGTQVNPSVGDFIASNIANPNQPVVLLNGMQVSLQTVLDIDINRIDEVIILKDAAATAEYGVRGGTGVLLIQTKRPKKGDFTVTYSGQLQVNKADLSSYQLMDASGKLRLEQAAGFYQNNLSLYQSRVDQVNKGVNTDWLNIPTRSGISNKHYLSLEGGDDDINYGLNFSYDDREGVMKGSSRKNTNFGSYIGTRMKNLTISNYLTFTSSTAANSPYGHFSDYTKQNAYWNPYDSLTGTMVRLLEQYTNAGDTVHFYNPAYNGTISTTDVTTYSRLNDIIGINWRIGSGFKLDGRFGITKQSDEQNLFLPPSHTSFAELTPDDFFKRGQYNQTKSDFFSWEGTLNLNYEKKVNLHQFYGSAGISAMETSSESAGVELIGFTSDKLSDLSFGNAYSNDRPQTGKIITRLASGYGNFTYSYDNRYQLELTANADGSSQFGENNLIAPHWSAGASWNLHQERFFHPNKVLSEFRIHASVGTAGSQFFPSYLGETYYNYYTDRQYVQGGSGLATRDIGLGAFMTGFANDNLKAPQTFKQDFGFNALLLNRNLAIRLDVYRNKTKGIVLPVASPSSTGFLNYTYYDNLGVVENEGMEFDLNYNIIHNTRDGIVWTFRLNGIHNRDYIRATSSWLDNLSGIGDRRDQTMPQPKYIVGQSLTGIWAVRSLGIDPSTGQEKFLKADGSPTFTWDGSDKVLAGDLSPNWLGSFGTTLSVRNISAGIYFNYQVGGQFYNQTLADKVENADLTYNVDRRAADSRWAQSGDNVLYKPLSVNGMMSSPTYATTRFVASSDFINCSAVSVDYTFSQKIIEKINAKNLKLGIMVNNIFCSADKNYERGIYYPFQRQYSFNITASF